jgi:hypothetical protein
MKMPILYARDTLTRTQLKKTLLNVKKFSRLGFYVDVHETRDGKFITELYGPKIHWRRKSVWEMVKCSQDVDL